MPTKSLFASKTFWVNLVAAVALAVQQFLSGWAFDAEWQAAALAIVNVVLRLVTKEPVMVRKPQDPDIPAAPRRVRRKLARDLANSVTRPVNVLLAAGLAALLMACAGATVRCDDPTLVLKDATAANHTRLVIECGGQEVASQEVDLGELAGSQRCQDPSLVLRGQDAAGLSHIELVCGGQVLAEFVVDLRGFMRVESPNAPDVPDVRSAPDTTVEPSEPHDTGSLTDTPDAMPVDAGEVG